ncbi:MAG: YdcF family protein [Deltaproteobacteria bacterium]|nr:YdcF family protein [Deltaproteobacteria bacterium]
MKKKSLIFAVTMSLVVMVIVSKLFLDFVHALSGFNGHADGLPQNVDVIVVLTGGSGRTEKGLDLLSAGRGRILVLSGVHMDADIDSIFFGKKGLDERSDIVLEKGSKSTYENAIELKRIIDQRGAKTMALVTSTYHMERAYLIFKRIMPEDMRIYPYMVSFPNFDPPGRISANGALVAALEFLKYEWYCLRFYAEDLFV